ncbi:hypothetical protein BO95DRAFT_192366 [Aspergillus brunneoviolaceus CBS 621.78]|uniref:Uncharacterized protein n=1 Tax=Aspergillus brunneoviolaceus CBS 621.78 TaxID=1450534 RepID=A0ACD1G422_9EURO|nr:hypothetical protein BO95DRAFT_192366 [Aspergillus brunneoviolaceus CBS 621.78]RAH43927.1 hypothetical protein BO95DRAFT_192366 [Aspergillus brunneoviolaceus CBS 621.78]
MDLCRIIPSLVSDGWRTSPPKSIFPRRLTRTLKMDKPQGQFDITVYKNDTHAYSYHIRPQGVENRASRPLSRTQATRREVSSWVGDHQRIPSVVCFFLSAHLP